MNDNKKECKIYNLENNLYIIPTERADDFESTSYYDRKNDFAEYILPDEAVLEEVYVDKYDLQSLIDGDLE